MRSDLMEKTGVNVNVKSLLAPWAGETLRVEFCEIRHRCRWANSFRRQRGKDYAGETACFGEAVCDRIPLRIQTKMEPRWEADGVFLGKLDLSDEVIVGTPKGIETTRSFRRMTEDREWNPDTLRTFVSVPWNSCRIITDSPGGIRKRYVTTAHWTSWMKCWVHSRSIDCHALVQQPVVKGCFCTGRFDGTNLDSRIDRSQARRCIDCDFVVGRRETCCNTIHT